MRIKYDISMRFDIFLSICQTEVNGIIPSERKMFENFFSQLALADQLGFGTAWIAESHLSTQIQKRNPGAVVPHFKGEIGLNTDILQLGHKIFAQTKRIHIGSAIRNILCNGGPLAHAEAVKTFLTLHSLNPGETRLLELGFASGRFPYSNFPYGIKPRNKMEAAAWPVLKGKIFQEATEIFLRAIRGDIFAAKDIRPKILQAKEFRSPADWEKVLTAFSELKKSADYSQSAKGNFLDSEAGITIPSFWDFDEVGIIPFEAPLDLLRLTIGCHDLETQIFANTLYPCGVFNLSITPEDKLEATHQAMRSAYHAKGGNWTRAHLPRTALIFIDKDSQKARDMAQEATENYWKAVEGTLDPAKVAQAVNNAVVGNPEEVKQQLQKRFHADDRLMCWFDFNNHDDIAIRKAMKLFWEEVVARI